MRSIDEIRANYRQESTVTQPGLIANWRFDEGSGLSAVDLVAEHDALLSGGAQYSSPIHPEAACGGVRVRGPFGRPRDARRRRSGARG